MKMKFQIANSEWRTLAPQALSLSPVNLSFEIRHSKFSHAFTLIELILAIGVAAIVLIAVNTVFFSALRLRNATTEMVDDATPIENAITILRRDLMCAVSPIPGGIMSGDFKCGDVTSVGVADMVSLEVFT